MISRPLHLSHIERTLRESPIAAILGPRQCGKTTLARQFAVAPENYFDLENARDADRVESPMLALGSLKGLVIIDEVQHKPELFPALRVLADRPDTPARFLILGSASPQLVKGVSESLAGRVGFINVSGFDLSEVGLVSMDNLWLRGGFPRSFLADSDDASMRWREAFIQTFLTRDIPQLGIRVPAEQLRRFWMMLAHYHAQTWNASEIARSLGAHYHTVQQYLDILGETFMVRALQPWHENLGKRLRKAPKIYFRDSGLFHSLLNIRSRSELLTHPKLGASWEGFAMEQVLAALQAGRDEAFYFSAHGGAELDLFILRGGKRYGFEIKFTDTPKVTASMRTVVNDLGLERLFVINPGQERYPLAENVEVLPLSKAWDVFAGL